MGTNIDYLNYREGDRFAPLPPGEQSLQTRTAEHFAHVGDTRGAHMEGLCFDRDLNLYYTSVDTGGVYRFDFNSKESSLVFRNEAYRPAAVNIHKDGRLFICCINQAGQGGAPDGRIFSIAPDGAGYRDIITGYSVAGMVFDSNGGFYFNDCAGDLHNPTGGVYYMPPDCGEIIPVIKNMAAPDGIALSTDETVLWVTQSHAGRIERMTLRGAKSVNAVYTASGVYGPQSCSVDMDDNLYVAMCGQGRVLILNFYGLLIGQVLLPDREKGWNLRCTHPLVCPGTRSLYIIASDEHGNEGANIYKAGAFAEGNTNAYQFKWGG